MKKKLALLVILALAAGAGFAQEAEADGEPGAQPAIELSAELRAELKAELKAELTAELAAETAAETEDVSGLRKLFQNFRNRGNWDLTVEAGMEGYLDLLDNATISKTDPWVVFRDPANSDFSDYIFYDVNLTYKKPIGEGVFSALFGIEANNGIKGKLLWETNIRDADLTAYISLDGEGWDAHYRSIILYSSLGKENFGVTAAGENEYWSEMGIADWRLLHFRKEPNKLTGAYDNSMMYRANALKIYMLSGFYEAFSNQLRMDFIYKQGPYWETYRDYFRVSDIVARNWDAGDRNVGFTYKPAFLNGNFVTGVAITHIGLDNYYSIVSNHNTNPPKHGAFERTVFGAKYEKDNLAFSAMVNLGDTGGSSWWFLTKNANDKDMEDGYFDLIGGDPGFNKARSEIGFNIGSRLSFLENTLRVNGDVEVIGLYDLDTQGMMAAGANVTYSPGAFTTGITARYFDWLGLETLYGPPDGGFLGIHPIFTYHLIPKTLDTGLRVDYVTGSGAMSTKNFVKLNPKIFWNINGDESSCIELGYTYRYDFNDQTADVVEHTINLKLRWRFL